MKPLDIHDEWLSLIEVSGPFLATPVLNRVFSTGLPAVEPRIRQYLRQAYDEWCEARDNDDPRFSELHLAWIHEVLVRGLEYDEFDSGEFLLHGERMPAEQRVTLPEHGVTLVPDYVLVSGGKSQLLVQTYPAGMDLQAALKIDGWIACPAERMERLCRASDCRLGLVTDGERWMLVDAPIGAVSTFASWYARLWGQERLTLQAFLTLLGIRRFFGPDDETLPSMLDESIQHQEEVTDALGEQVRRAVEVLIQALDKEDRERSRTLLQGVEPTELYEAGLTIMMRLVFLLSAEERGLLLMGERVYESNYAISTLRMQLRRETEEVLERRNDAWSRLLATFRAVYGGIEHETLRLPALGGSLFDPNRFPFLEGRAKGSDWKVDPARPLPIDNRTVLLLLEAIQQYEGRTLSYRGLDVEQIGYVYEGLLERTVARTERVTVELTGGKGAKKTLYGLEELEALYRLGEGVLTNALSGADAIKRGAGAIHKDLERSVDAVQAGLLLTACAGDEELRDRALPILNLLRTDPWGYPLIYPEGAFIVTTGSNRRETGAHYTPKSLTERIVETTLVPVIYVGPAKGFPQEQWRLKSAAELLDLKICDPAMGSGAFLVQVCRWLAERIVDAWAVEETAGRHITSEGEAVDDFVDQEGLPVNLEDRLLIARRLVAERCLYGVDLNPLAVELAKLSIWLVTLAKGRPFGFLDHNLKCGDSLLGIHRIDQLTELSMAPGGKGQQHLFGKNIELAVREAIELRQRLREMPIRDIHDVEAMARLDEDARRRLELPELIADAFIGGVFAFGTNSPAYDVSLATFAIQSGQAIDGDRDAINAIATRAKSTLSVDLPPSKASRLPFHWAIEFPEVFQRENRGFDAFVGNPPFLGGKRITGVTGTQYRDWLVSNIAEGRRGSADLVAYFFLRAFTLLREGGHFGLLAVNTIAEGDTRQVGLEAILKSGALIHAAYPNEPWPGSAAVITSRVHVRKGEWEGARNMSGQPVPFISAFLSGREEWSPKRLKVNEGIAFIGSFVNGMGFVLSQEDAQRLLDADPKNSSVIFPYLNGEDINTHPEQKPSRYVISFWDWPEEQACEYELPWRWIEERVKPERQRRNERGAFVLRRPLPERWWQYADKRPALYHTIGRGHHFEQHPKKWSPTQTPMNRVLVSARVGKYFNPSLVYNGSIFHEKVVVFRSNTLSSLSFFNSSIAQEWIWNQSSTLGFGINFAPTDALEPFPLSSNIHNEILEALGARLDESRRSMMVAERIGLTKLYNRFHAPDDLEPRIEKLRELQCEIDFAVAQAYGWDDLDLGHGFRDVPYLSEGDRVRYTISEPARIEVLRRLAELNRQRYDDEVAQGLHGGSTKSPITRAKPLKVEVEVVRTSSPTQSGFNFEAIPAPLPSTQSASRKGNQWGKTASDQILSWLEAQDMWFVKTAILNGCGVAPESWEAAIAELLAGGFVELQGTGDVVRYKAKG